jgi:DNA-directed RNA polymerase beta subunit
MISIEEPKNIKLRGFDDPVSLRKDILDRVLGAYQNRFPLENDKVRIEASDVRYDFKKPFSLADEKKALLNGDKLSVPLRGKISLVVKKTNDVLDEFDGVLARVPWMTHRGTFINSGSEYSLVAGQQRLKPGVYARRKDNGELESHVNTVAGTGAGMRIFMEPETGVYRVMLGKSRIKLYPVLKGMGIDDDQIMKYWGPEILDLNKQNDDDRSFGKFYDKLMGRKAKVDADEKTRLNDLLSEIGKSEIDPEVGQRTLGTQEKNLSPMMLLRASQKLLNIQKGLEEEDDRDSMANKNFVGPEDLFEERVKKDAGKLATNLLYKSTYNRTLKGIKAGYFSPQLEGLIVGNSLSNHIAGINPLEIYDYQKRVVQTGEGAITSSDAIPISSRNVSPSQVMVIDPIRSSESKNIGVDQRFSSVAKKGSDGNVYFPVRNIKTGKNEYINAIKMSQSVVAFPKSRKLFTDNTENTGTQAVDEINEVDQSQKVPAGGAVQFLKF